MITSSVASILEPKDGQNTFTEARIPSRYVTSFPVTEKACQGQADWNNYSANLVEKEGSATSADHKYRASKVLAERAAWKWAEDNKADINFDLVTILPPFVSVHLAMLDEAVPLRLSNCPHRFLE